MAEDTPRLIGCEACGVVNETATVLLGDARETIDGLERDLRSKRAAISRLERSKADRLQSSRNKGKAAEVLQHWQATCMRGAREIESEDRLGNVLARLAGGFSVDELKMCADGYAKKPFVVGGKRSAHGKPTERHADAELIYRTPKHVQAGLALAEQGDLSSEPAVTDWEKLDWRKVRRANHRVILRALSAMSGRPLYDPTFGAHFTDCPRCLHEGFTVWDPESTHASLLWCHCGLDEALFFRALRDDDRPPQRDETLTLFEQVRRNLETTGRGIAEVAGQRDEPLPEGLGEFKDEHAAAKRLAAVS